MDATLRGNEYTPVYLVQNGHNSRQFSGFLVVKLLYNQGMSKCA